MSNFIAFRFCDNDFHGPLREAIEYVVENRTSELSIEAWREYVLLGLVAFNSIRRIDQWSFDNPYNSGVDYRKYFEGLLKVIEVKSLNTLDKGFEGYVFDKNTLQVHYYAN